ncbi:MAG: hypothetical protein ABIR31_05720 [Ginsengibacter sp.]
MIGAGVGGGNWACNLTIETPTLFFDFGPGINALAGAIIGVIPGSIIGVIRGSQMGKFNFGRNKEKFENMRAMIMKMAHIKNGRVAKDSAVKK